MLLCTAAYVTAVDVRHVKNLLSFAEAHFVVWSLVGPFAVTQDLAVFGREYVELSFDGFWILLGCTVFLVLSQRRL